MPARQALQHVGSNPTLVGRAPVNSLGTICVFCGASRGSDPDLIRAAESFGEALAAEGIRLVYGGGSDGLMGAIALGVAQSRGDVVAIIPDFLASRMAMLPLPHEVVLVPDMHSRKRAMFDRADAFVALPGGVGTIEELAEVITWRKLDQHRKPILIANFRGFWRPLIALFEHLEQAGFMRNDVLGKCLVADDPHSIIPTLRKVMDRPNSSRSQGHSHVRQPAVPIANPPRTAALPLASALQS